jgi:pyrimidine operon attenuation protein/uracil phosphoribosyltransferase
VIVNSLLAKHLSCCPSDSLAYFAELGDKVATTCGNEKVLVIGFAETATAVAAAVAMKISNAVFVHTTREELPNEYLVSNFSEEHSHAKHQALYLKEKFANLDTYDRLVFVEDELTTGKTIINFLNDIDWKKKITVSALVFNSFNGERFSKYDADFVCLRRIYDIQTLNFDGFLNPRIGIDIRAYEETCKNLVKYFASAVSYNFESKNVAVIGTEEFMFPAIKIGQWLESAAKSVVTHSTTRSPLAVKEAASYPFISRAEFASGYDNERLTFLYNIGMYDAVVVVTDCDGNIDGLLDALRQTMAEKIFVVRVRNVDS